MNVVIEITEDGQSRRYVSVADARLAFGTACVDEALAPYVASRAELLAVHGELGDKVQELIAAADREQRLCQALDLAVSRLKTLNRDVFDVPSFTDRYCDGDANRGVIAACREAMICSRHLGDEKSGR